MAQYRLDRRLNIFIEILINDHQRADPVADEEAFPLGLVSIETLYQALYRLEIVVERRLRKGQPVTPMPDPGF